MPIELRTKGSRSLFTEVRDSLARVGVYPCDLPWMALAVTTRLEEVFEFTQANERQSSLRRDVATILAELPELESRDPEYQADYVIGRLEEKYRIALHAHLYEVPEEPKK